jgi:hypothetical protein
MRKASAQKIAVLAHRDADLAAVGLEGSRPVERAPDLGARRAFGDRDDRDAPQRRHALVQRHALHFADAERRPQVRQEHRLVGDALDRARLARRHLADIGGDDRVPAVRDRRHPHRHVEFLQRDVPV